jgi:hypothetical protein
VLSHLLGSNPRILGYSELHMSYLSQTDVIRMRETLHQEFNCNLHDKYLLDKILHNRYIIRNEMFEIMKPKIIFLLREPKATIKSIINMGHVLGHEWHTSQEKASEYYCSRLLNLEKYASEIGGDFFFIESDNLINNTDCILDSLSHWLNLNDSLQKNYATFANTGRVGYGDFSNNISSGVLKKRKKRLKLPFP